MDSTKDFTSVFQLCILLFVRGLSKTSQQFREFRTVVEGCVETEVDSGSLRVNGSLQGAVAIEA